MFNKKLNKFLAAALCGFLAITAIPTLPAKAENIDVVTYTDCAEYTEYKMTSSVAYPEADKAGWQTARVLTDTENGLLVKNTNNNSAYVTRTSTPVSMDGAHMKLTFDSTTTNKFYVTINNNRGNYNNHSLGIRFTIGLYSGGSIVCHVDGTQIGSVSNVSEIGIASGAVEIKTSITDAGDFVFNINGYDYVISSANWASSTNLSKDSAYFAIAPSGNYAITYTWNYFHGREDICYSEVVAVDALIENMTTNAEIIAARKAYLALSDTEKAVVENAEILKNTAGTLFQDSDSYLMTSSVAYPEADKSGWETARVLTDTENGLLVKNTNNNSAYVTRTSTPVSMDGAHMKLTFDSTTTNKFYVTINNNRGNYNNHSLGIRFTIGLYSGGSIVCHVDGTQIGSVSNVSEIGIGSGAVEIKTSITDAGDFVFNINGYDYVISSENWAESDNLNRDSAYFAIAPSGNYAITYTWNYFHGVDEVCFEGLADVEAKIELCDLETPNEADVNAARAAYDALSEKQKAIVINYDKLLSAELKIAEVAEMKVYDFFDLTQMTYMPFTHIPDNGMVRPLGVGDESKKANIGVKMMVTIGEPLGEARFGLCKSSVWAMQDGSVGDGTGYDIQVKADGIAIQKSKPAIDLAKVSMAVPSEFVLEYGIANICNSKEEILARKISVKVDGVEVLSYVDRDMSNIIGNNTIVWTDSSMLLSNIDPVEKKDIDIYLIAGQSNAAGCSTYSATGLGALDYRYVNGFSNVLYAGSAKGGVNSEEIQPVRAGLGMYDFYIGPELGIANALSATYNTTTGKHAGIIKLALGGTSLVHRVDADLTKDEADWVSPSYEATLTEGVTENTGYLYSSLLVEVERQLEAYRQAGYNPTVKALYWMQGEEDRYSSDKYPEAFRYFASDIRNDLTELTGQNLKSMPIVMGLISRTVCSATAGSAGTNQKFIAMQKALPEQVCNLLINDSSEFDMNMLDENGNNVSISSDPVTSAHWKWEDVVTIGNMVGDKFLNDLDIDDHVKKETWVADAENHWKTCKCGECQYDVEEHAPDIVGKEEATIEKEGYTGDKVCTICNHVIEKGSTIGKVPEVITSMSLSKTSYVYDGKVKKPTVTVKNQNGKVMKASSYTVTYASGCKSVGTYKVTVTKDGKTLTKTFQILPPATSIKSISTGTTKPTVKWTKKTAGVTGYQIQYATNKSFKSAKSTTVTKDTTTSKAISMSKGKTYYVRIRTYEKVSGKTYYSSWSSAKSTKIPNTTTIKSVKAGSKKLTVKWSKKTSYVSGYQIQYSTSKSFKSAKTVTIKKDKTTSTIIKKLKGKKKYYVRIRTYEKSGSTTYYSAWGTAKSATTKK